MSLVLLFILGAVWGGIGVAQLATRVYSHGGTFEIGEDKTLEGLIWQIQLGITAGPLFNLLFKLKNRT